MLIINIKNEWEDNNTNSTDNRRIMKDITDNLMLINLRLRSNRHVPWKKYSINAHSRASLIVKLVTNLPALQETWVWSLGWEDPWLRRERLPTPVFWPGEFHGLYSSWGCKESDTTEWLTQQLLGELVSVYITQGSYLQTRESTATSLSRQGLFY